MPDAGGGRAAVVGWGRGRVRANACPVSSGEGRFTLDLFGDTGKIRVESARQRAGLGATYNEAIHPDGEAVASVLKFRVAGLFCSRVRFIFR